MKMTRPSLQRMLPPMLALLLTSTQVLAATGIWRCGADGREFSDRPCSDGQMLAAPAAAPDAQALREAQLVASRERALADALRKERHERQRVAPGSGLLAIGPVSEEPHPHARKHGARAGQHEARRGEHARKPQAPERPRKTPGFSETRKPAPAAQDRPKRQQRPQNPPSAPRTS